MRFIGYYTGLLLLFSGQLCAQNNQASDLLARAQQFQQAGNCNQAIPLLEAALQQYSTFSPAVLALAQCYNQQQAFSKTIELLQLRPRLLQVDAALLLERARAFAALGNVSDAQYDLDRILQLQPAHVAALTAKADMYRLQLQNSATALIWYQKAIAAAPDSGYNYAWAGWCCNNQGLFTEAIPFLQQALQKAPLLQGFILAEWGFALYGQNNYTEAKAQLQRACTMDPKNAAALYYLGLCYVQEQNKAAAVKQYNYLVLLKSTYAPILLQQIQTMHTP